MAQERKSGQTEVDTWDNLRRTSSTAMVSTLGLTAEFTKELGAMGAGPKASSSRKMAKPNK